ncbi:AAA family ATPase [Streptomyces sp. NPDC001407]|uniref:AAA family ATPase n=1 Tax=Streptomyces sp. NPDC001407 TaxID=3364573 RepID=UPI0036C801C7
MLVNRAYVPPELVGGPEGDGWPWDVPCVKELVGEGIVFDAPVTFLVGENGSGKSTIVEAIAEAYGLDGRGGRAGRKYGNDRPPSVLGGAVRLDLTSAGTRMVTGPRTRKKGYFLRAETAFGLMERCGGSRATGRRTPRR